MKLSNIVGAVVSTWLVLTGPGSRRAPDERGGSETIAQVLLIGLAIAVVAIVGVAIRAYVRSHLP